MEKVLSTPYKQQVPFGSPAGKHYLSEVGCVLFCLVILAVDAHPARGAVSYRETTFPIAGPLYFDQNSVLYFASTGSGGAAESVYRQETPGALPTLYAEKLGDIKALAPGPRPGSLLVADGGLNSRSEGETLILLEDLNHDGDCMDDGEHSLWLPTGTFPLIRYVAAATTERWYVTEGNPQSGGTERLWRLEDLDHSQSIELPGEKTSWVTNLITNSPDGLTIATGLRDVIFLAQSFYIFRLEDVNGDGVVNGGSEFEVFARFLPNVAFRVVQEGDGHFAAVVNQAGNAGHWLYDLAPDEDGDHMTDQMTAISDWNAAVESLLDIAVAPGANLSTGGGKILVSGTLSGGQHPSWVWVVDTNASLPSPTPIPSPSLTPAATATESPTASPPPTSTLTPSPMPPPELTNTPAPPPTATLLLPTSTPTETPSPNPTATATAPPSPTPFRQGIWAGGFLATQLIEGEEGLFTAWALTEEGGGNPVAILDPGGNVALVMPITGQSGGFLTCAFSTMVDLPLGTRNRYTLQMAPVQGEQVSFSHWPFLNVTP